MQYKNGKTQLICIHGEGQKDAWFVNINNNELIKGNGCIWVSDLFDGNRVTWGSGNYYGLVADSICLIHGKGGNIDG